MCEIWQNKNKYFELSTQDWKVILNGLKTWLGRGLIWFTGGEPFLRKDILELIQHCHKNGQTVGIISNGILINRDIADNIIDVKLVHLHVSLYR